jgi:hypothetical protein
LSLFAGEAVYPGYGWEQVAPVGDLAADLGKSAVSIIEIP